MNVAEKRRAEQLIDAWKVRRLREADAIQHATVERIEVPAVAERSLTTIRHEIANLATKGYSFEYHPRGTYNTADATSIVRTAEHPLVNVAARARDEAHATAETEARQLVVRVWAGSLEFDQVAERIE